MTLADTREEKKVRLAIECSPEERRYIKMFAAREDKTINDFVLECVHMRMTRPCTKPHIPNKKTSATLDATERGQGLIHYDSIEEFMRSLRN